MDQEVNENLLIICSTIKYCVTTVAIAITMIYSVNRLVVAYIEELKTKSKQGE